MLRHAEPFFIRTMVWKAVDCMGSVLQCTTPWDRCCDGWAGETRNNPVDGKKPARFL